MSEEILNQIDKSVKEGIKMTVNGKIDALAVQVRENRDAHDETRIALDKLATSLDPVIEAVKFINTSRRFILWIATPVAALGALLAAFNGWFK